MKHIILLTDGGADPTGIAELVAQMHDGSGITLSTVAVGTDAAPWLSTLAQAGQGRHHAAVDPASIPSIFTEETTLVSRSYLIEEPFFPQAAAPSPLLTGIAATPQLLGYVGSTLKPNAQQILAATHDDPLLAFWQYGLGKAVAWTSDASGRWAQNWLTWPEFPRFWAQVVRATLSENFASGMETAVEMREGRARLTVDARSPDGATLNGYEVQASAIGPDGAGEVLHLRQTAPGRYEAEFAPNQPGAYLLRLTATDPAQAGNTLAETAGWVLSYSPEYRVLQADPDMLARLALLTGGNVAPADPAAAFARAGLTAPRAVRPIWPLLLLAAAVLLPADIAVRRLALTRADIRRGLARLAAVFMRPAASPRPERAPRLSALLAAKERAGGQIQNPKSKGRRPGTGDRNSKFQIQNPKP